ncbi:Sodium- and chloride-dependent GABA transporter 1 [Mucor velutinosus]|uniref:Sodium- and chloride-dependent GABA transporter 1 n=1 Tax=Mucor velutinosus TaxID=708070 RepID=A0AAN7DQT9_9FUNG|nr:Sodium- and chloride-dependent GABA transporter 1 [Mucor velutinosus]
MEDTSRQQKPHSNKPCSSNTTSPTSPLGKKSLESIVGRPIKIKTASNEQVEGLVYTYDRTTNCLVIDYSNTSNTNTTTQQAGRNLSFRIIKISHIKEIISLGEGISSSNKKDYLPVNQVQVDRLKSRESEALKGFQSQVSKIGVGVTKEGQDIFNALSKTLPCRWSKDTIVVMDEILITPPYGVENCKANATSSALLARVKKVLEGERKRLAK